MKFHNFDIVFQEIPGETTLAINITGCPNRCEGCHSPHLWEDTGEVLDFDSLQQIMAPYNGLYTCICFMGGDGDVVELVSLVKELRQAYPNVKVGWYSGKQEIPPQVDVSLFNYIKIGPYIASLGGLKSKTTNQRLYNIQSGELIDITSNFWRK